MQSHPDTYMYRKLLFNNGGIHYLRYYVDLGQRIAAEATLRQADELFTAAERAGSVKAKDHIYWRQVVHKLGSIYLCSHNLEAAKRCFLRVLAWPRPAAADSMNALQDMARYHYERKEWKKMIECCEEALLLVPQVKQDLDDDNGQAEERLLLLPADAWEGVGDMRRARECDKKAKVAWRDRPSSRSELVSCLRRDALELWAAGRWEEAVETLQPVPTTYAALLLFTGINLTELHLLLPSMTALKLMAHMCEKMGIPESVSSARRARADVEETEAILSGYWEGVLKETRWELEERRRAAAAAAAAPAVGSVTAEEGAAAGKKSKAAKRKQQKRKAQQQKKAAERADATAAAGGADTSKADDENEIQPRHEDQGGVEQEEEQEEREEEGEQDSVTPVAAALAAMAMKEKEEEEEDECSVCLNAIDSKDAGNQAGPPLVCGHRYHAFCFGWSAVRASAFNRRALTAGRHCRRWRALEAGV